MAKRYYIEISRSNPKISENGDWRRNEDYEKLADLCEKMTVLLKCVPPLKTPFGNEIRAAIAEAGEVLK